MISAICWFRLSKSKLKNSCRVVSIVGATVKPIASEISFQCFELMPGWRSFVISGRAKSGIKTFSMSSGCGVSSFLNFAIVFVALVMNAARVWLDLVEQKVEPRCVGREPVCSEVPEHMERHEFLDDLREDAEGLRLEVEDLFVPVVCVLPRLDLVDLVGFDSNLEVMVLRDDYWKHLCDLYNFRFQIALVSAELADCSDRLNMKSSACFVDEKREFVRHLECLVLFLALVVRDFVLKLFEERDALHCHVHLVVAFLCRLEDVVHEVLELIELFWRLV